MIEVRGAKPRKWFWLVGIVPNIRRVGRELHIGFWRSQTPREWHPVMHSYIMANRFGVHMHRLIGPSYTIVRFGGFGK